MKKLILILWSVILATSYQGQSQDYHPFPTENAIWHTAFYNMFNPNYKSEFGYYIDGDTILGGKQYKKIFRYSNSLNNTSFYAGLRENDNKQIFCFLDGFGEQMLYDFNLQVGETMHYDVGGGYGEFQWDEHHIVVTSIDSILLQNDEYRKRWKFDATVDTWVEGIGSIEWYGLFDPFINIFTLGGDIFEFACFRHNDTILYLDNPFCQFCRCFEHVGMEQFQQNTSKEILIHPNPARSSVQVNTTGCNPEISYLIIRDLYGRKVKRCAVDYEETLISLSGIGQGIYFLEFYTANHHFAGAKKILKN